MVISGRLIVHAPVCIYLSIAAALLLRCADGWLLRASAARASVTTADDESLDPEQRIAFSWKRANPVGQLYPLIAHKTMVKFSIILGPTYLLAAVAYNLLSQLYPPPSP